MWCVADLNDDYVAKMEDVLETYEKPYDPAEPVVCVDEKPVTLPFGLRVRTGDLPFSHAVPEAKTIHLVLDNLNIHRRKSLTDLYGAEIGGEIWDRFTIHYTPTHGSHAAC
jgi:hypothetical protein